MKRISVLLLAFLAASISVFSQEKLVSTFKPVFVNWHNGDIKQNKVLGTSVNKAYTELLAGKTPKKTVIVAVIDGGVDVYHEDLKGKIWTNTKEIAGNNVDDDKNGYVDDIYGWNFLGNSKGENIAAENLEYTRIYKAGVHAESYDKAKALYDKELKRRMEDLNNLTRFEEKYKNSINIVKEKAGKTVTRAEDLNDIVSTDAELMEAVNFLKQKYKDGFTENGLNRAKARNAEFIDKYLNLQYNPRAIVGDDPNNINDTHYGNADVKGPDASHGTGVAGIIAAVRNNGIGMDGIADNVKIMVLRTTPDGDERDKDVALAIRYAVENGADIINMSFGKAFSPQKNFVDDAIKFAESRNVLVIHAAGNEGSDIDTDPRFPSDVYNDKTEATNFLNVGASGMEKGKTMVSIFSNYGQNHVDIFAPGENIVSLDTGNTYTKSNGTSEAAPVVSGIAALLLTYYPELTPKQVIEILMTSGYDLKKKKVMQPDLVNRERASVKFGTLSKSGSVVNAYNALKIAETYNNALTQKK